MIRKKVMLRGGSRLEPPLKIFPTTGSVRNAALRKRIFGKPEKLLTGKRVGIV
jgi:hypothetical protein